MYTDEVTTWLLFNENVQYFSSQSTDPVTIMAAMTKWMTENDGLLITGAELFSEYDQLEEEYFWHGKVGWVDPDVL